jgi:hypothetical protein
MSWLWRGLKGPPSLVCFVFVDDMFDISRLYLSACSDSVQLVHSIPSSSQFSFIITGNLPNVFLK